MSHHIYRKTQKVISTKDQVVEIDFDLERGYTKVEEIAVYTDTDNAQNKNLVMVERMTVDNAEVYCREFDAALLHPSYPNDKYKKVGAKTGVKSKLKGVFKDTSDAVATPYTVTVQVRLSKED